MNLKQYIFPIAFAMNSLSMTGFMVILGLSGKSNMAADFGIVHAATMALFYAFSANARSLILNLASKTSLRFLLINRFLLIVPLGAASYFLSVVLGGVYWPLALILICRRAVEWIAELHLSEQEFQENRTFAKVFIVIESFLFLFAVLWTMIFDSVSLVSILIWAILPLSLHLGFIKRTLASKDQAETKWAQIAPQFGSTAINGVTVYVFRLFILLLAGKSIAGDLYTAYAIGGFIGTTYLNALGPTLVHKEGRDGRNIFPGWLKVFLILFFIAGAFLFIFSLGKKDNFVLLGKSLFFWGATGLSMVGGSLMVLAQRLRISVLQLTKDRDVFGPDLLINILIVAIVPFSYYLFGKEILSTLFLCNALIAFIVYSNIRGGILSNIRGRFLKIPEHVYKAGIAFILVFPLFFQLTGKIFNNQDYAFDSKGMLTLLPIPISVFACFGGLLLISSFKRATLSLFVIFMTFLLMLATTIISSKGEITHSQAKLIFLIQFILPFFGLVLGQVYEGENGHPLIFEKAVILVLILIVPAQLISTWWTNTPVLYNYFYIFSIYQHFQYVSIILVCLYFLSLLSLWDNKIFRFLLILLGPLMGVYVFLSLSVLCVLALTAGTLAFIFSFCFKRPYVLPILTVLIIVCSATSTFYLARTAQFKFRVFSLFTPVQIEREPETLPEAAPKPAPAVVPKVITDPAPNPTPKVAPKATTETVPKSAPQVTPKETTGAPPKATHKRASETASKSSPEAAPAPKPPYLKKITDRMIEIFKRMENVRNRLNMWRFHINGILSDVETFFLGHAERPPRDKFPSAHNYYLDLIYNFGFIAAIPILGLLFITIRELIRKRARIFSNPHMLGLAWVTLFLLLVDNSLKVGLRQPYPGIITFFLWGLLLSRLIPNNNAQT